MFRRPRPEELEERPVFSKRERLGAAVAHAAPLLFRCPPVSPARERRVRSAAQPHYRLHHCPHIQEPAIGLGRFPGNAGHPRSPDPGGPGFRGLLHRRRPGRRYSAVPGYLVSFVIAFLLFLYTMWGAWDTAWGYDFRYILISHFVDRITSANLLRQELRRQRREASQRGDPPPQPPSAPSN